ncbi:hypothetical protein [Nonomuraea insulae]|uniref:Uncharacterized protein n=1 Tax=Nonomuraea insulae TaxID=1616787 RepID=A0ABW1CT73_9ACTN
MSGEQRRFELSMPQIAGSALSAVTAAVAASYLGVAGTVIGAAVVSIASTIATAVYTHYLKQTEERVKQHTLTSRRETSADRPESDDDGSTLVMTAVRESRRLPWVKLAGAAVIVFAVSMGSILAYQAVAQETVHEQVTGKTPSRAQVEHDKTPVRQETETEAPPAYQPPPTPTHESVTPTPTPTPTPSRTPSTRPTPTPTPTGSDTVEPSEETTSPPPTQDQPDEVEEAPTSSAPPPAEQDDPVLTPPG